MPDGQILFHARSPVFLSCYLAIKKLPNTKNVQILWCNHLWAWFREVSPPNFLVVAKSPKPASNDGPGRLVKEVRYLGPEPGNPFEHDCQSQIFFLECKSAEYDTSSGWTDAAEQLTTYLGGKIDISKKVYCAMAIGTRVELYLRESANNPASLRRIHAGTLDLGSEMGRCTPETALHQVSSENWDQEEKIRQGDTGDIDQD